MAWGLEMYRAITAGGLARVKRREMVFRALAYRPAINGYCLVAFTRDHLAWRPVADPLSAAWSPLLKYHVVSWAQIRGVEVSCSQDGFKKMIRVCCNSLASESEVLEFSRLLYLGGWIRAFRKLGLDVRGCEVVAPTTLGGILRDYGWTGWVTMLALVGFTVFFLSGPRLLGLYAIFAHVATLMLYCFVRWKNHR
jgi:hypothetical protein